MHPTRELYDFFTRAYAHFNRALFDEHLAPCMLTVQRQKGCMGLFYPGRWVTENGRKCHELALNPTYFGACRMIEVFQTLVHEQCHMWQQEYGRPSRSGYHNREWADKMQSLGLMPSDTGAPGGRRTGQHMSDYALAGGQFIAAARACLAHGGKLQWLDSWRVADSPRPDRALEALPGDDDAASDLLAPVTQLFEGLDPHAVQPLPSSSRRNKTCYTCGGCGVKVWGRPGLGIRCEACDRSFDAAD